MGLDVPVHNAVRVAVIQCFKQLVNVVANVIVCESGVEDLEVGVVYIPSDRITHAGLRTGTARLEARERERTRRSMKAFWTVGPGRHPGAG